MIPSHDAEMASLPSRRTILVVTAAAALVAGAVLLGGILPAEFGRDPVGLGRLLGTAAIWSPPETEVKPAQSGVSAAHSFAVPWRSDVIDIPLKVAGDPERGEEVEYKVRLPKGGSYVYSWEAPGIANPEEFYTEFHGHTVVPGQEMTVAYYRKATGTADQGVLTAPFDGVHGWYFQNQSEKPVTVRLRLAGFYTLIPDGEPGNEAGLHARSVKVD